jgi:hypothetical protein
MYKLIGSPRRGVWNLGFGISGQSFMMPRSSPETMKMATESTEVTESSPTQLTHQFHGRPGSFLVPACQACDQGKKCS